MKSYLKLAAISALFAASSVAYGTPTTENSPTGGSLPAGVTKVGGLVVDLKGANGTRVVSQLAASQMYRGFADSSQNPVAGVSAGNPLLFGTQNGYDSSVIAALGGGIASASFRITLFDGDTSAGNFDFNRNTFFVNGISVGNWSNVITDNTDSTGTTSFGTGLGFADKQLHTGFFTLSDIGSLASLFGSLGGGSMAFTLNDATPFDNFYDFTRGVDGGLIDVGTGPVVQPAVPEPATWIMMLMGFGLIGAAMRRKRQNVQVSFG